MHSQTSHQTPIDHELVQQVANAVKQRGMATPAIFILELHKPFATVISALATFSQPVLDALVGPRFSQRTLALLGSRDSIEALIVAIESSGAAVN